jgi:hypothetical protein
MPNDEDFDALQNAQPSIPDQSDAERNTFLGKINPIDASGQDSGYESSDEDLALLPLTPDSEVQAGTGDNPLPYLPDIQVYDTDGTTILYAGHGSGVWPIVIDGIQTTTDVSWYKIAWCEDRTPGTRFALLSAFVPD